MRAGSVAALAKTADRVCSQSWARYFYEHPEIYGNDLDGIWYSNAHNDEDAIALFECAQAALICNPGSSARLDDPAFRPHLEEIAQTNNLVFL
jgi:hypothetical protein